MKTTTKKKYETNPFIKELKGKMYLQPRQNTVVGQGEAIVDLTTGELKDGVLIGKRKIVDKSQFAKIYASEMAILYELSKPAQKVFLYLSKNMDYNNKAHLRWKRIYKTYSPAYQGIIELIKKEIIAPCDITNVYWLNPVIVCKGERFAKYIEYVTPEEDKKSQIALEKKEYELRKSNQRKLQNVSNTVHNKISSMNQKAEEEEDQELPF